LTWHVDGAPKKKGEHAKGKWGVIDRARIVGVPGSEKMGKSD